MLSGLNDRTPPTGAFYGIRTFHGQDTNVPAWTPGSTTPPTPPYTNTLASNPSIVGSILPYTWSQLNPSDGTYVWSLIDNDMLPWINAGKQVELRVVTASSNGTDSSVPHYGKTAKQATPQWVFTAGAVSVVGSDGVTVLPVYWDTIYQAKYLQFLTAFAARYDGNPNISGIVIGMGVFGELTIDNLVNAGTLALWQAVGYTQNAWTTAYTWAVQAYKSAFVHTPLNMPMKQPYLDSDGSHNQDTAMAIGAQNNVAFRDNGLVNKMTVPTNIQVHNNALWAVWPYGKMEEQLKATIQTGSTLLGDIALGLQFGGLYLDIYSADILLAGNAPLLAATALAQTTPKQSGVIASLASGIPSTSLGSGILGSTLGSGLA